MDFSASTLKVIGLKAVTFGQVIATNRLWYSMNIFSGNELCLHICLVISSIFTRVDLVSLKLTLCFLSVLLIQSLRDNLKNPFWVQSEWN